MGICITIVYFSTDCFRFEQAVGKAENARITYKQLIGDGKKRKTEVREEEHTYDNDGWKGISPSNQFEG